MTFGRNPHVAKAQAAEQKARDAKDDAARAMAWREAARQWDRAAEREDNDKRKQEYLRLADEARARADGEDVAERPIKTGEPATTKPPTPDRSLN